MGKAKGVKILQYDLNNNFIKDFISIREASRETNVPRTSIGKAIKNNTFIAGNFIWKKE